VNALWPTLTDFLLRLSCGLAVAMLLTPAKWVNGGFFRVHLWVLMGLGTFASLAIYSQPAAYGSWSILLGCTIAAGVLSYAGAVVWMYDARTAGKTLLALVAALFGVSALLFPSANNRWLWWLDFPSGALVLGSFMAAMLLGHWYLNHPGMKLEPIKLLVRLCAASLAARAVVAALAVVQLANLEMLPETTVGWSFLAFRWLAGIVGPAVMAWLTWETLKVPNTQSATGILYAAVTLTFLGELTAQLLSRGLPVPV
jgi:hypothetical protein